MEEEQKKFDTVEIVLGTIICLLNDAAVATMDLMLAIPGVGQVIAGGVEIMNIIVWATIAFWFIMKLGAFGAAGLVQVIGGLADFIGIPGRTASFLIGVFLVNHPKLAAIATTVAASGAGLAKGGLAAEKTAATETRAAISEGKTATGAKVTAPGGNVIEMKPRESPMTAQTETPPKPKVSEKEFGVEPTPFERLQELTERPPEPEEKKEGTEEKAEEDFWQTEKAA